ncbi:hypothetical protein D3C76_1566900 [compost metagenome]
MFRRVAATDDHLPGAAPDSQDAALAQTAVMVEWRGQEMRIAHHREHLAAVLVGHPGLAVEIEEIPTRWLIGGKLEMQ